MKNIVVLLLFCHVSSPVKHSLKFSFTTSTGVSNVPQFVATLQVDEVQVSYCDSNKKMEAQQEAWKQLLDENPQLLDFYTRECFENQPKLFKHRLNSLMQLHNQSGGVHILQTESGCEWDENTGEVVGFLQYHYDGEDFISLDLKNLTWIALKPQADAMKQLWDSDEARMKEDEKFLTTIWPDWLKKYVNYENSSQQRTDLPSVSLLQKTPSSPVSCHATGFYPDRASMFWRKDGEEIHEDMDHGEILPNHDGTFQMRVDLNISSVKPEDWSRYDCVFQISGVKKDVITKLNKTEIRTNWGRQSAANTDRRPFIITGVIVSLVFSVCVTGLIIFIKKVDNSLQLHRS
ncbi:major histocompatibility complex class I-related gene protein-like isoform X2 [Anabas testudineus]|uniref:major histocompatibility complex class I-related gene protein-like isoform X2 n=1 Tax=Anabas testudineus TaxID=64144 RepID=UPI00143D9620|nr:major histocompatibility complex class I-related gene protein-like isoform X2 [Anabas testudineus]